MNFPGHAQQSLPTPPQRCAMPLRGEPSAPGNLDFHLPVLTRSVGLLRVLLHDGIVDVELVSSVIALDPGLTYRVLQLANRDLPDDCDRIWQLPLAVVTAGRAKLDEVLNEVSQVEFVDSSKSEIQNVILEAVLRACLAHTLACELASYSPRKCFLSGLLFELPALVTLTVPARIDAHAMLLSDMCHSLPVTIVRAALAQIASKAAPSDPMVAIVLIAQELLRASRLAHRPMEELAAHSLWRPWPSMSLLQRRKILERCGELIAWVGKNLYHVHPWEFMAQLESNTPCG
jgi:HDOD domain-containing protein